MPVSPLSTVWPKMKLGFTLGLMNLITVAFGIYSIKYVSIPIFLTFRRCSLLTSFFVSYLITGKGADSRTCVKLALVTAGAMIAGYDTLNRDWIGYILIWMNNLS